MKLFAAPLVLAGLALSPSPPATDAPIDDETIALDFEDGRLPDDWSVSSTRWRVKKGALEALGAGHLQLEVPRSGDFELAFTAWTEEKANVEVKLVDPDTGADLWTFAFLGTYHSVLDGPKSCILRGNRFVHVDSRTWIFPGREFEFRVRGRAGQYQTFVDDVLGPRFVDEEPPAEPETWLLRILHAPEVDGALARIDDVVLTTGE